MRSRSLLRRSSSIALTSIALLAAACGGDDGDGGSAAPASDVTCPVDALEQADGPVEIDVWHTEIGLPNVTLEKIAQRYNDSQDQVTVNVNYQGTFQEQFKKYEDSLTDPDSLPDIIQPDDTVTQWMADSGTVIPASACIEADPDAEEIYDDMVPIVPAAYTIDGTLWPAAYSASGAAMYANEEHMELAGLDPADPPTTLAELRETAQAIKDADLPGLDAPLVMRIESWPLEFWTSGAQQPIVNEANGRDGLATESEYANDVTAELLTWMQDMQADGLLKITEFADILAPFLAIATESSSLLIDTSAAISTVNGAIEGTLTADQVGLDEGTDLGGFRYPDLRLTVAALPGLTEPGKGQMGGAAWYLVDGEDPAKVAASWDFIKFFNATEQQVTWAMEASYFPVRESAVEDPALQAQWNDTRAGRWMATAYEAFLSLDPAFPGPVIGPYAQFRESVITGLENVMYNDADPVETMTSVDEEFQADLDSYAADVGE